MLPNLKHNNRLELVFSDVCLPDYWSGHHLPVFQVMVDNKTLLSDLKQSLRDELNQGAFSSGQYDYSLYESDVFHSKVNAAINRIKTTKGGNRKVFPELEYSFDDLDEYDESSYAFFVLTGLDNEAII